MKIIMNRFILINYMIKIVMQAIADLFFRPKIESWCIGHLKLLKIYSKDNR